VLTWGGGRATGIQSDESANMLIDAIAKLLPSRSTTRSADSGIGRIERCYIALHLGSKLILLA